MVAAPAHSFQSSVFPTSVGVHKFQPARYLRLPADNLPRIDSPRDKKTGHAVVP